MLWHLQNLCKPQGTFLSLHKGTAWAQLLLIVLPFLGYHHNTHCMRLSTVYIYFRQSSSTKPAQYSREQTLKDSHPAHKGPRWTCGQCFPPLWVLRTSWWMAVLWSASDSQLARFHLGAPRAVVGGARVVGRTVWERGANSRQHTRVWMSSRALGVRRSRHVDKLIRFKDSRNRLRRLDWMHALRLVSTPITVHDYVCTSGILNSGGTKTSIYVQINLNTPLHSRRCWAPMQTFSGWSRESEPKAKVYAAVF